MEHTDFVLSIGRNVGDVPMSSRHWVAFKSGVHHALANVNADLKGTTDGTSTFYGPDGTETERSYSAYGSLLASQVPYLENLLSDLAVTFRQWGIALTIGETVIIEPYASGGPGYLRTRP